MLERLVANWLISSGERGYETAFAQLLTLEGFRVLHGPVHHPFEHGKDIVALSPEGALHAYQLKGGDIALSDIEQIMPQLLALAATPVTYPGVMPPRKPDRAFLVTNGKLTAPSRDRLAQFNAGNQQMSFAVIECIEQEHLLARFVTSQGDFIPAEPAELEKLLKIYLGDGRATFPIGEYLRVATALIDDPVRRTGQSARLRLARAALLTNYMLTPWSRNRNHLSIAQAWLSLCSLALHRAALGWPEDDWLETYELAFVAARRAISGLLGEALEADDLVIPDMFDGFVYGTRVLLVCGYLSAFLRSENLIGPSEDVGRNVASILKRECPYVRVIGEVAAPFVFSIAGALCDLSFHAEGVKLALLYSKGIAEGNQPDSEDGVPDPYHSFEELLLGVLDAEPKTDEKYVGSAYTVLSSVQWFARRDMRLAVEPLWPLVSKLILLDFRVSDPALLLAYEDSEGELLSEMPPLTASWATIREEATKLPEKHLPAVLWRHLEFLPYLPLLIPHRYNIDLAKALDYTFGGYVEVLFDGDEEGEAEAD